MSVIHPTSLLFVPGTRPERIDKARAAGPSLVCIDLEDAVAPELKASARQAALDFMRTSNADNVGVRINSLTCHDGLADAHELMASGLKPAFVMLPKVDHGEMLNWAAELFDPAISLIPIVESARGLAAANEIFANTRVTSALFGAVDYTLDVGSKLTWDALFVPRVTLLNAAAIHDVTLLDVPYIDVRDLVGLEAETKRTAELGMRARSAIHPDQISVIHQAFAPTTEEIEAARRVVEAFAAADGGAALLDGKLIELPVIRAAERLLARAESNIES